MPSTNVERTLFNMYISQQGELVLTFLVCLRQLMEFSDIVKVKLR